MRKKMSKAWRVGGWALLAVCVTTLVVYNAAVMYHSSTLRAAIIQISSHNSNLEAQLKVNEPTGRLVAEVYKELNWGDRQAREKLQTCTSRENFVVRSGPRIAWCELKGGPDDAVRIGLYLPAGKHRLRYAFCDVAKMRVQHEVVDATRTARSTVTTGSGQDQKEFRTGDVRKLPGSNGCELEDTPRVFQITMTAGPTGGVNVAVLGGDSAPPRDCRLALDFSPNEFRTNVTKKAFAFPSEVKLTAGLPPATDIGFITVHEKGTKREADIRLWIESDSPPCLSAIDVAANYMALAGWEEGLFPVRTKTDQRAADVEFKKLFLPYDGSDRLFLRQEMVAKKHTLR